MTVHMISDEEIKKAETSGKLNGFFVPGSSPIKELISNWKNNDTKTSFKMGEVVFFKSDISCGYGKIIGINNNWEGNEYALKDIPYLLWEDELAKDER